MGNLHKKASLCPPHRTRCDERMASSLGRNLICFYCNRKSTRKQDGTIRQWECPSCDAINYLDENGEITDPPVATFEETPLNRSFAKAIPPPEWSTASAQDAVFCQTCIKNQHLYRSSLAQYLPEDPTHPDYAILSQNINDFEKQLEERYPQVCENCVDRVQNRMKRAVYGAKVDAHGRQLERTRMNGGPGKRRKRTWLERIQDWGRIVWASGIYLELACEVMALLEGFRQTSTDSVEDDIVLSGGMESPNALYFYALYDALLSATSYLPNNMSLRLPDLAVSGLFLSLGSMWWNPEFRYTIKNGLHEVRGLEEWYAHQAVLFLLRVFIWYTNGTWIFSDARAPISLAAHAFVLAFTAWISMTTAKKVTVKSKPIFSSTPDRAALIARRKATKSPGYAPNSLYEALNSISQEPIAPPSPISPVGAPRATNSNQRNSLDFQGSTSTISYIDRRTAPKTKLLPDTSRSASPFSVTNGQGASKSFSRFGLSLPKGVAELADPDEMEWTPSQSEHRAFNSGLSTQRDAQHFNQAPSGPQASPFWYKVPAAPVTPARKLRNPPNQPWLSAPSEELKQNFFNKMTMSTQQTPEACLATKPARHDYAFAQPKFFPPDSFEDSTGLADAFGQSFTFDERKAAENERVALQKAQSKSNSLVPGLSGNLTCLVLGLLLSFWNLSFSHPTEYSRHMTLVAMVGCILIGLRSFMDYATIAVAKMSANSNVVGAVVAGAETAGASYILLLPNTGFPEAIGPIRIYGSLLITFMMIHQLFEICRLSPSRLG